MPEGLEFEPRAYLAVTAAIPAGVGLASGFSTSFGCLLFLLCLPLLPLALLILVIRQVARSIRWMRADRRTTAQILAAGGAPLVMLVIGPALALVALRTSHYIGTMTSLAVHMSSYRAIIAAAELSPAERNYVETHGITYSVDPGPPVRVAFNQEGFLDNWSGIIFDPSGRVMEADGFHPVTGRFVAAKEVTDLFGGDLVACRHLWDDFYSC